MNFLALDLSVKSTGWALYSSEEAALTFGSWALAADLSWRGRAYVRLHRELLALHRETPIDDIVFEEPLSAGAVHGHTSLTTLAAMAGLAAHVESFAEAIGARHRAVNLSTWRRHFIGKMSRGTKSLDWKALAMTRCRELGFDPAKHDEAEAIGLLDYQLSVAGILAPWRADHILEREMTPATDGKAAVA